MNSLIEQLQEIKKFDLLALKKRIIISEFNGIISSWSLLIIPFAALILTKLFGKVDIFLSKLSRLAQSPLVRLNLYPLLAIHFIMERNYVSCYHPFKQMAHKRNQARKLASSPSWLE